MFKVNEKRAHSLREVISFLMNWNNPQRDYLVQVSILGGQSPWGPDNLLTAVIVVLGCSFFRTNGERSHNAEKPDGVPLRIHKIHYCQLQSLKERTRPPKVMQILEKIGEGRQEGKKFSGERERRRGGGRNIICSLNPQYWGWTWTK